MVHRGDMGIIRLQRYPDTCVYMYIIALYDHKFVVNLKKGIQATDVFRGLNKKNHCIKQFLPLELT